ncbi:hydrogenase expression/formation protein [Pseudomonas sp. GD04087]|uniref:hydrogenase expression/formation protein n=1 Tax=unclassified Pseudomonas TaxID=196821 RepID=UPI002449F5FD|nr:MULTISPECIES: hydrogenase expression/formation protein [unclassified Pseudomonas]MDH0288930.1 hydrogenase expression/formation protein [Pseudomonas sp. GD04087]MDH1051269.1 hydrogenase expression/formation protein [Pseudomonas sp. GD03903]MDH1999205.1 hydrogenase expression/formation protein [Pseudomonas sp. GD03691]
MNGARPIDPLQYIPVMDIGPGSQPDDDAALEYISMPQGMYTHSVPQLPEPQVLDAAPGARQALGEILHMLRSRHAGDTPPSLDLRAYSEADCVLLDQVLGEGEVSARIGGNDGVRIQESIFAGVWRVLGGGYNHIDVEAAPALLRRAAKHDACAEVFAPALPLPAGVMNAPAILTELQDRTLSWRPGSAAHVINLSLLPLSAEDVPFLDERLGEGSVLILARGYGNCRISNTRVPNCWRVRYFNSQDALILDTIEVTDLPEVVLAAPEDIADSLERFEDVIQWFEGEIAEGGQ